MPVKFLIIDDDAIAVRHLASFLEHQGHSIELSGDACEWKVLQGLIKSVDVVIYDPCFNRGTYTYQKKVYKYCQAHEKTLWIHTSETDRNSLSKAREHGARQVLIKPVNVELFGALVEAELEGERGGSQEEIVEDGVDDREKRNTILWAVPSATNAQRALAAKYSCQSVYDFESLQSATESLKPSVLVTDIVMDHTHTLPWLATVNKNHGTRVVIYSKARIASLKREAMKAGIQHFLPVSSDTQPLLQAIEEVMAC